MRLIPSLLLLATVNAVTAQSVPLSLSALAGSSDGKVLYVACATPNCILCFDAASRKVLNSIPMPEPPLGLALSADDKQLFVTCAAPESKVCIVNATKLKIVATIPTGHTSMAPVLSPDKKTLYVCNRFNNSISVFDLVSKKETRRIPVKREPVAADITRDGKYLLVANHLPAGRADIENVVAVVSVIDMTKDKVIKELQLPNGSGSLNDIRVSPDGNNAVVTHTVAGFNWPANQVNFGWMNANALTIIDLTKMEVHYTLLLDEPQRGAANPWGVAWSADGKTLAVSHAGTHEVSIINFPVLLANILDVSTNQVAGRPANPVLTFVIRYEGMDDVLPFLTGARERVKLPEGNLGPRALTIIGRKLYVANYFSDTLNVIDLDAPQTGIETIFLGPKREMEVVRKGEFYFHDATICSQGWQSCSSCHPGDARADGFDWDLLNDGFGNPKNTKSLVLAHKTPPVMSLGVRGTAETAVRAGIKFILFTNQPESVATSIDEYLKSLKPVPSPHLAHGKLSDAAKRGEKLFSQAGCADCHVPGLYTDLHPHDVGTRASYDRPADTFYTPTLTEAWRTAPYLHTGSAATMRDVITTCNADGQHGDVSGLSSQDIDDLCEYVLSL
jgi:YVTN family beta-propeller protein